MKSVFLRAVLAGLLLGVTPAIADGQGSAAPSTNITPKTRMDIIHTFTSELVYIRSPFPMGRRGLTLKDGALSPSGDELQTMIAMWGPAVKPGDQAMISAIAIKNDRIHFEINGGPVHKKKWYQHIEVGGMGGTSPIAPGDTNANPRGSYVDLVFDRYVPEMNPQQLKDLLRPVFDFDAKSPIEAYLETVPPKVKAAIKEHRVLVGMNREMVIYSMGRAPKKTREKDGEIEYEEWIYGDPPKDVDFVRFVGDEVVRVETIKVTGDKSIRTEKEVDLQPQPSVAKGGEPEARPANAPTLRRPGEAPDPNAPTYGPDKPSRPAAPPPPLDAPGQPQQPWRITTD
jgi:hypothetical protein